MGPERDRNGATARQLSDSDATRTTAIQIIRGFLAGGEVPGRVKDAWKHVENAFLQSSVLTLSGRGEAAKQIAYILRSPSTILLGTHSPLQLEIP